MCGIFACSQVENASECVFEGLRRLEYRGYDSWGVAGVGNPAITITKKAGKISGEVGRAFNPNAKVAIGHTRWATHGGVTDANAHPHLAQSGAFTLVQNGVVENYQELKTELLNKGYKFQSETDTEVIVGLLEQQVQKVERLEPTLADVQFVFRQLTGRNTIAVVTKSGWLFAVRDGSPLVLGCTDDNQVFLSSDTLSMAAQATRYYALESGQAVAISPAGQWQCYAVDSGQEITVELQQLDFNDQKLTHDGFDSFMEKEIHEQSTVLSNIFLQGEDQFAEVAEHLKRAQHVLVVGAGGAAFAAGQVAWYLRGAGIHASMVPSYEANSFVQLASKQDCAIILSQSGETADTNEVVEQLKARGVTIISVVNMRGSTLSQQLSDVSCMLGVGPEIAVASTKATQAHVLWGWAIAGYLSGIAFADLLGKTKESEQLIARGLEDAAIQKNIRNSTAELAGHEHQFILGRGELYFAAAEAALKLKEVSYTHAESFSGGELKHGMIALIEQGTPVFFMVQDDQDYHGQVNAMAEVKARGGRILGVSPAHNELFDDWIQVPQLSVSGVIAQILPFQVLTCAIAQLAGRNPDKPRNLAKSVTVK